MAGRGPAPETGRKINRRNEVPPTNEITEDDELRGFELPEGVLPGVEEWHPATCRWWHNWRKSAQAQSMLETDWDFLLDTALMHHTMWLKGKWEFASELRLRVAKFGATLEDRSRLRMDVTTNNKPQRKDTSVTQPNVTDIASRRSRLSG